MSANQITANVSESFENAMIESAKQYAAQCGIKTMFLYHVAKDAYESFLMGGEL